MNKTICVLFVSLASCLSLWSQSWEGVKANKDYLYGEGWGNSIDEADKQALSDLISKISVSVSSSTANNVKSSVVNGQLDELSQFSSSVNTYTQATLTNTERVIIHNEPNAHVGRWIKRSEIERIFASRIAKIKDMVDMAAQAESKGNVDVALRNYYWAFTLLKSLQRPNDVSITDADGRKHMLVTWIPECMNAIFANLSSRVVKREGSDVELYITYKGKPVSSVDYTYFDGQGWSNIYSAKDGRGVLELAPSNSNNSYQLKFEFEYRGQAQIDRELESVLNAVKGTAMNKAYTYVKAQASAEPSQAETQTSFSSTDASILKQPALAEHPEQYVKTINTLLGDIRAKRYDADRSMFTPEGWEVYQRLMHYGSARIVGNPDIQFFKNGSEVVARGAQMSFSFKTGVRKSFVEDVVFTFDAQGKVCNVAFGLGNTAANDILYKGVWSDEARMGIMNFLENYKTAYGLKRLDYIRSVFDDDAVIIVGSVARVATMTRSPETNSVSFKNNTIIKKNRYTKDQYLNNLKRCFDSNEYINVRFANNDVRKLSEGGELYAIQIAQDYYSSSYGDKGYLFLMVDINDPKKPIIKVRTWQPDKDPNFGIYSPGDF